ncbi:endonuclease exonuclease phosphatase family protein [Colletotrichum sojae]|uniref:Endonuclease exonuclease phosphatase family protein n=1 Tax=Colletotrichum sojae TaxID=2175907 RepID=A0A8H6JU24_9PEZI|nr:endonuclease exonuclease phosphatase family protein [Colletotrichum sojae]
MKIPAFILSAAGAVSALTIAEINGNRFLSPYKDQSVTNVTGLVLAKGPSGVWIRSTTPDDDDATSEAVYVYGSSVGNNLAVGDIITLDGKIQEYRSSATYIYLTEISSPTNVVVVSKGNEVTPLVIGADTSAPPTEQYTSLDGGDVYGVPNAAATISAENPVLDPKSYGFDFWESLSGELVTVKNPVAVTRPNQYGDTWIVGDWPTTGRNSHGGITMTAKDSNPEAIVIGSPLDGTKNPESKMGDQLAEITGVVTYAFGFYRILPLTAVKFVKESVNDAPPTSLVSKGDCRGITVGAYNVENLAPTSAHLPAVAAHIVDYMKTPDLIFVQEVQDNTGPTNNGVVSSNITLSTLAAAIETQTNGSAVYDFVVVDPVDGQDGGQPGGNIRVAYLYRPDVVELWKPNPGGSLDANEVLPGPELKYNPGRIEPASSAWDASRKPLVAAWRAINGPQKKIFFTVNVHFGSKGGSSSLHGDPRPPSNGGVDDRIAQAELTGDFIGQILAADPNARIIAGGDFNEFTFVEPLKVFTSKSGLVDLDEVVGIPPVERYTYVYDMNAQQLDHMFVSPALAKANQTQYEHVHINSWELYDDLVSDHDPSVALFNVCGC